MQGGKQDARKAAATTKGGSGESSRQGHAPPSAVAWPLASCMQRGCLASCERASAGSCARRQATRPAPPGQREPRGLARRGGKATRGPSPSLAAAKRGQCMRPVTWQTTLCRGALAKEIKGPRIWVRVEFVKKANENPCVKSQNRDATTEQQSSSDYESLHIFSHLVDIMTKKDAGHQKK